MAAETASPETAPAKFSRYRSVRLKQAERQQQFGENQQIPPMPVMPPVPPMEPQKDATVSRSMSRYHRRPTTSHATAQKAPPGRSNTDLVPPLPTSAPTAPSNPRSRALSSPQQTTARTTNNVQPRLPNTSKSRAEAVPLVAQSTREPSQTSRIEAKQLLEREAERHRRIKEKQKADKQAKLEAEQVERDREEELRREAEEAEQLRTRRALEEAEELRRQKEEKERGKRLHKTEKAENAALLKRREDEARKAKHEEEARKAQASPPTSPPRHPGGFGLFNRRRKDDAPISPERPVTARPRQTSNGNNRELDTIRPGGGGAVLGIDAPISAVNAGDRRVQVVCNKQYIFLPVTPTTTPLDLIKSAATCLTEPINPRYAVILESFQKVGLTRPLRNYEHVRDVMNSWDDDKQNDLIIVDSQSSHIDQDELLALRVPDEKPEGMGCYINYSSKPGKWSKRYVTLRADGQLLLGRKETDKAFENICHLSDFDIYSPTERKIAKVKPPKKFCYAVKSQQKSNIYMDETRFVHFFCTNDRSTSSLFYKSLQGWRSWYLKHVMGEGQKKSKAPDAKPAGGYLAGIVDQGAHTTSHTRGASVGSHYQLGSFMPLLDLDQFSKELKEDTYNPGSFLDDAPLAKLDSKTMHRRNMSSRTKGPPPLSYTLGTVTTDTLSQSSNRQTSLSQSNGSESDGETFAAGGLLGRKYSQRQRALQEKEQKPSGPFTEGPSLLNNLNYSQVDTGLQRRSSVRSNHRRTSSDIQRSTSTRGKPKPLVDLTPQYKEPPQHARKGKGFKPEAKAGPLIENATSIEEAIKIPDSQDWRARPQTARPTHGTYGIGGHERTRSLKGRGEGLAAYTVNNHTGAPDDDSNAFTGGGLLARTGFSQGHTPVGHGVMDGSKARGPMLDVRDTLQFASGSLLAGVERKHGPTGPLIDRDKRQSVDLG